MKEAGFRYQQHKKTYYVDQHKDPNIVADRNNYVSTTLPLEIYEHCWIQRPQLQYLQSKLRNQTHKETLKREKGVKVENDFKSDVDNYITENRIHFNTSKEGVEMVEEHVDEVYLYNTDEDKKQNLPHIGKYGGSLSVRLPPDAKP